MKSIYLAGPIDGLSYTEARHGWREQFAKLIPSHIQCYSPMRAKQFLKDVQKLESKADSYAEHALATAKGITSRDRNDVLNCSAMVANFLGAKKLSGGTCMEFGWADAWRKPIIMIIEKNGVIQAEDWTVTDEGMNYKSKSEILNPHWHPMLTTSAGYIVDTLEEAAYIATHLLTPGV